MSSKDGKIQSFSSRARVHTFTHIFFIMSILPLAIMLILFTIFEQDKHDRKRQDRHDKKDVGNTMWARARTRTDKKGVSSFWGQL